MLLDKNGTVKISDMGLARLSEDGDNASLAHLTNTGIIMGTVDFMAPEQALDMKMADARADIYALGCSLFYLLTGKFVYEDDTIMKRLLAHREQSPPSLQSVCAGLPEKVETVFKRMVAKKAEDRYQKMTEVIAALEQDCVEQSKSLTLYSSDMKERPLSLTNAERTIIFASSAIRPLPKTSRITSDPTQPTVESR